MTFQTSILHQMSIILHRCAILISLPLPERCVLMLAALITFDGCDAGGRDDVGYFGDVWAFDFAKSSWTELKPEGDVVPNGRDHHSSWIRDGKMFVYGKQAASRFLCDTPFAS